MDVKANMEIWNEKYNWSRKGEEWSEAWGGSDMEWYATLLPRIHSFVPTGTILEIAPGFGRWSKFLVNLCKNLILVDLSEKCIQSCKNRFKEFPNITYHINDGKSLEMIPDESIDFVFSFDSLVHVEQDVIELYLNQLCKKLKKNGVGFIHHSNIGEYKTYFHIIGLMPIRIQKYLGKLGMIEKNIEHARAYSMTAHKFRKYAEKAGLRIVTQEMINWGTKRLIDCISVFTRGDSKLMRPGIIKRNKNFMEEAKYVRELSKLYSL